MRILTLKDLWLEGYDHIGFLHLHGCTLESVKLVDINLGGSADLPHHEDHLVSVLFWLAETRIGGTADCCECETVADEIAKMQMLKV